MDLEEAITLVKMDFQMGDHFLAEVNNAREFLIKEGLDPDKIAREDSERATAMHSLQKRLEELKKCGMYISQTQFITDAILKKLEQPECPDCGSLYLVGCQDCDWSPDR